MNYPVSRQHKMDNKQLSNNDDHPAQKPSQSSVEKALTQINEEVEGLGDFITSFENRLRSVVNEHLHATTDETVTTAADTTGDSSLLLQLYSIGADIRYNKSRLISLMDKLDI